MIRFLLQALNRDGSTLVAGRLQMAGMTPPNAEPLGDITTDGGFAALTGNQIWLLASILPLLFGPIFAAPKSMVSGFTSYGELCTAYSRALISTVEP